MKIIFPKSKVLEKKWEVRNIWKITDFYQLKTVILCHYSLEQFYLLVFNLIFWLKETVPLKMALFRVFFSQETLSEVG